MKDSSQCNNQSKYMNLLKALGIIAVVMGHASSPFTSIIYSYHMPLFFFISGYFFKDKYLDRPLDFVKRRFKSLYLTFVLYELFFVLIRNLLININVYTSDQVPPITELKQFLVLLKTLLSFSYTGDMMLGAFWFLKSLFFVNILFLLISLIFKKLNVKNDNLKHLVILGIYSSSFLLFKKGFNLEVILRGYNIRLVNPILAIVDTRTLLMLMCYYIGYLYKKYEDKIPMNIYGFIVCLIIMYLTKDIFIDISSYTFTNPIYLILLPCTGVYCNLYIAKFLCRKNYKAMSSLEYIGKNSVIIMALHFLSFKFVSYINILIYSHPINMLSEYPIISGYDNWWVLYTIAGVLIPALLKVLYDSISFYMKNNSLKASI